jgi:ABC-2 type transport system permease protein
VRAIPYAIFAALVVFAISRRLRRRRNQEQAGPPTRQYYLSSLLGHTGLVAQREVRERLRGRFFRVITLVLLAVVAAAIVIPTLHSSSKSSQTVGVVGTASPALRREVDRLARNESLSVRVVTVADLETARLQLSSGRLDLVINGTTSILVNKPIPATDTSAGAQLARSLAATLGVQQTFRAAGLSTTQIAQITQAKALPIRSVQPGSNRSTAQSTSLIGVVLVFVMLTQYLTWTLMGVMEEKASRVVEVLLAAVKPIDLLGGKLLGIGLVALFQAGLVVAFALILAKAVGSDLLHGTAPLVVVATLIWLVLGYAFYSWVYAAAGSLTERQDQVQSLALPLSVPIIFGYIISLTAAGSGNASVLVKVLAFLPPTAPFAIPTWVALGGIAWWELVFSAAISVISTFGVARVAAAIYRRAVLRTGGRVRLRSLLAS